MMRRFYRYIVLFSLLALAGCGGIPAAGQGDQPQLALAPCRLNTPGLADYLPAKCTTLTVFEDRAAQCGRTIDLHIAVVPAVSRGPAPDPLFFLAGGPGQSAGESYPLGNEPLKLPVAGAEYAPSLVEFLKQRNVIIQPAPADPQAAVSAGDAAAVLVISPAYGDAFRAGRPATVQLVLDNSRQSASVTIDRTHEVLG